ncbi:TPA: hypothetical protein ACH3X2_000541 [Trebouxia sp. C0005]
MICRPTRERWLCGTHRPCRQTHIWLQPCRRRTAAGNVRTYENFSKQAVAQRHTASGVCCQVTAAQPQQQQGKDSNVGLPDISQLSLQLQQEWHPDNNALLGGVVVKPGSNRRVMWSCPNCPAGCPHIWKATVNCRTRGTNCPYCQGKTVCQHSSLATQAPRQTRYWNYDKNAKTPEETLAGSGLKAEWKCSTCSYEWQAVVAQRVRHNSGCPRCNRTSSVGNSYKQPTFEEAQHPLLLEWDYERNTQDSIHPQKTTLGSKRLVHWVCRKCPKGQLHLYQMTPNNRTSRQGSGCPYCAGKQVCKCNSLEAHAPTLSSEWDSVKNRLTPADVTSQSHKVVWWKNSSRGSWQQCICDRTDRRKKK